MTDLAPYQPNRPQWLDELEPAWNLAKRLERAPEFVPAGFANRAEAIMAAILTGAELGHGPMWSLRNIVVINGRTSLYAEAMRALVLAAGHEIWAADLADHQVTMAGRRRGSDHTTTVTWTIAQAEKARLRGKATWEAYPRAMLTARATTELCRLIFADVVAGMHTVEELDDGFPLEQREEPAAPVKRARRPRPAPALNGGTTDAATPPRETEPPAIATAPVTSPAGGTRPVEATVLPSNQPPLPGEPGYDLLIDDPGRLHGPWQAATDENAVVDMLAEAFEPVDAYAEAEPTGDFARRKLMAAARDAFPNMKTTPREVFRHALTAVVTRNRADGPIVTSTQLTDEERLDLTLRLQEVRSGALLYATEPDGKIVFSSPTRHAVVTPPHDQTDRWTVVTTDR